MLSFLIRRFIRDADQLTSPVVRRAYGTLCGALGIALNLLLFGGKKIPELMKGLGKGVKSFKEGVNEAKEEINKAQEDLNEPVKDKK